MPETQYQICSVTWIAVDDDDPVEDAPAPMCSPSRIALTAQRTWEHDLAEYHKRRVAQRAWDAGFHERMDKLYEAVAQRTRYQGMVML